MTCRSSLFRLDPRVIATEAGGDDDVGENGDTGEEALTRAPRSSIRSKRISEFHAIHAKSFIPFAAGAWNSRVVQLRMRGSNQERRRLAARMMARLVRLLRHDASDQ